MNAKKADPSFVVNFDKPRKFCLNLKGLMALEKELAKQKGVDKVSIFKEIDWSGFGASDLAMLCFAGLYHDDPSLTFDKVSEIVDVFGLINSRIVVIEAIERAFPEAGHLVRNAINPKMTKGKSKK